MAVLPEEENAAARRKNIALFAGVFGFVVLAGGIAYALVATGTVGGKSNASQSNKGATDISAEGVVTLPPSRSLSFPPAQQARESLSPTMKALNVPTLLPSMTLSLTPSLSPSTQFTGVPSQSAKPSMRASLRPSSSPSTSFPSFLPSNLPTSSLSPTQEASESFGFYVMGDTPYAVWEQVVLEQQIANMTLYRKNDSLFTVHVGDLWKVDRTNCGLDTIDEVSSTLLAGPLPTFVMPGDNDSKDCPDPDAAWERWLSHFIPFEQNWANRTLPGVPSITSLNVTRNYPDYPQMFTFVHLDVLFLSVHLLQHPPTDEALLEIWDARQVANYEWAMTNIDAAYAKFNVRAVVIFTHGLRAPETRPFFEQIGPTFTTNLARLVTPVLYIHGDGHVFEINTTLTTQLNWVNFREIQVDQGGFADPLFIEVAPMIGNSGQIIPLVKEHSLQIVLADGLIRLDRQRGRYPDRSDNTNSDTRH
jgi:hypothetical protein